uniref:Uncharacterized protein n=1 Tax=Branchiostoma floridae TaxID=7739 RepID=C3ZKN2_BRAFL|eukprot:XP_002590870.1 hypothetical protein BRAFLDRAFT_101128 [Branchiostoma floridae]
MQRSRSQGPTYMWDGIPTHSSHQIVPSWEKAAPQSPLFFLSFFHHNHAEDPKKSKEVLRLWRTAVLSQGGIISTARGFRRIRRRKRTTPSPRTPALSLRWPP